MQLNETTEELEKAALLPDGWHFRKSNSTNLRLLDATSLVAAILSASADEHRAILHNDASDVYLYFTPATGQVVLRSGYGRFEPAILTWAMNLRAMMLRDRRPPPAPKVLIRKEPDWAAYDDFLTRHEHEINVRGLEYLLMYYRMQEPSVRIAADWIQSPLREQALACLGAW